MIKYGISVELDVEIWPSEIKGIFVAYVPSLQVMTQGRSIERAEIAIQDAVEGYLKTSHKMHSKFK